MAKRKRLTPATLMGPAQGAPAAIPSPAPGGTAAAASRAPIAQMAGSSAEHAALEELSSTLSSARAEGRLVSRLPLDAITSDHLLRDRITLDEGEMAVLVASLKARGQQTPIEVVALDEAGRYGLISGWRRIEALRRLDARDVLAFVRSPKSSSAAYLAMIEENEVRAGLSFYERARLASEAAEMGLYPSPARAVAELFASASASKRSKILNFVTLHKTLGSALLYPAAIPEKLGLSLVRALGADPTGARRLKDMLRKTPPDRAEAERAILERALRKTPARAAKVEPEQVAKDVYLTESRGKLVLNGQGVTPELAAQLRQWLSER